MSLKKPLYIDPMVDFAFKKIFRDSGKTQLLIRPLNAIFNLDIAELKILQSEHLGQSEEDRTACFDLECKTPDGRTFIIEVQLARQTHFLERALYYTTFPIQEAAPKDKDEHDRWDYNYPPVFFLGLLNFNLRHLERSLARMDQFIHQFTLRDELTGELMTDRLRFAFLEVARFDKTKEACDTFEDRFLFMMKNLPTFAEKPELLWDDPYFDMLLEEAEFASMTREEQKDYRISLKMKNDYYNTIEYARNEGIEKGIVKGIEKGKSEVAKQMLDRGMSKDVISELTGLSEAQIAAL